jgi:HEAT repeat protein
MGLLSRFKERKATRCIQAAFQKQRPPEEAVAAARRLRECATERSIPILCEALEKGLVPLQIEAAHALAELQKRSPNRRILGALNSAVLHERKPQQARQAAIESLVEVVDVRRAGSLIEVLKSNRSPMPVRAAALRGLKQLGYPEVLERLVESYLFGKRLDPNGEIRKWAVRELIALDDNEKLTKIFEIVHGRHKLRYRPISAEEGGAARLVHLMAQINPKHAMRFLNQMVDDTNPGIRQAAAKALKEIKTKGSVSGTA